MMQHFDKKMRNLKIYLDAIDVQNSLLGRNELEVDQVGNWPHCKVRQHHGDQLVLDGRDCCLWMPLNITFNNLIILVFTKPTCIPSQPTSSIKPLDH